MTGTSNPCLMFFFFFFFFLFLRGKQLSLSKAWKFQGYRTSNLSPGLRHLICSNLSLYEQFISFSKTFLSLNTKKLQWCRYSVQKWHSKNWFKRMTHLIGKVYNFMSMSCLTDKITNIYIYYFKTGKKDIFWTGIKNKS